VNFPLPGRLVLAISLAALSGCTAPLHTAGSFQSAHPLPASPAPGVAHAEGVIDGSGGVKL